MRTVQAKVILLGDAGVGKTSLIERYTDNYFGEPIITNVAANFARKLEQINEVSVCMDIWDTAGQERYDAISRIYFRGCKVVLLVFDVKDVQSFLNIENWMQKLPGFCQPVEIVLIGNKADARNENSVSKEAAEEFAASKRIEYFETSAKTGENVQETFQHLAHNLYLHDQCATQDNMQEVVQNDPSWCNVL
mmetsp:Transcript_19072/g.24091  ORF Transcript_19072/g.24091 Transcript_19072/m.24091 type:complete len:192 (+) Transcript_19072:6-581(+)